MATGLMHRPCFAFVFILPHLFGQAPPCRVPYGQDMHPVAPDREQDAVLPVPLAVEKHTHFLPEGLGIGVDRATPGIGLQRFHFGPDAARPSEGRKGTGGKKGDILIAHGVLG